MIDDAAAGSPWSQPGDPGDASRGRGRESAIRDAALELLAEVGYDRMSMDAVAARAHASKATIYRRWPGKQELVLDAVRCRAGHAFEPLDTGSLRGDIVTTLRNMAAGMGSEDVELMAGVMRAMRNAPELADCVRASVIEQKRYIGDLLVKRGVERGELPAGADPAVFHETAGALMFFRILVTGEPVDDAFLCHIADDVIVPLLKRSGQPKTPQEKT